MACSLFELEQMSQTQLIMEVVTRDLKLEYSEKEEKRRGKELKEINEKMTFQEIVSAKKDAEINKKDAEINKLQLQLALQSNELDRRKPTLKKRVFAAIVSFCFIIASIVGNIACNFLTNTPPNPIGNTLLGMTLLLHFVCTAMSMFIAGGTS